MNPGFLQIKIDGANLNDSSPDAILVRVRIIEEVSEHTTCEIVCEQSPDRRFPIEDWIGKRLEVAAADDTGAMEPLFDGFVRAADLDFEISGRFAAVIAGATRSAIMDVAPRKRSFKPSTRSSNIGELLGLYNLGAAINVEDSELMQGPHFDMIIDETDFAVLKRWIGQAKAAFRCFGDTFDVFDNFSVGSPVPVRWRAEAGMHSFRLSGRTAPNDVEEFGYARQDAKSEISRALNFVEKLNEQIPLVDDAANAASNLRIVDTFPRPTVHNRLEDFAEVVMRKAFDDSHRNVHATATTKEARIKAGGQIDVQGDVDFAGLWGVLRVEHIWQRHDGYLNRLRLSPYKKARPSAWPERPPVWGLYHARVERMDDRPDVVIVRFPWEENNEPWFKVQMAPPNAGAGRGIYFRPEIGDDILVAFREGVVTRAMVHSCAWNGVDNPPSEDVFGGEVENNDIKRIVTKSGNRLVMDDKEGSEAMIMATPRHVRVSLFDGGRTLLLHSDGNINIHAGGTVHIKCAQFLREVG